MDSSEALPLRVTSSDSRYEVLVNGTPIKLDVPGDIWLEGSVPNGSGHDVHVHLHIAFNQDALRYMLKSITVSAADDGAATEVDSNTLRAVRVAELVAHAVGSRCVVGVSRDSISLDELENGPYGHSPHERVAGLWAMARVGGLNPNTFIGDQLDITPQAAAQRVARARRLGLIPPASTAGARR